MNQEKIGKFIADLRKGKEMTQEDLSKKLGVSNKTISRWENGNYMPDLSLLIPLCDELNISVNELLSGNKRKDQYSQKDLEENLIYSLKEIDKNRIRIKRRLLLIISAVTILIFGLSVTFDKIYFTPENWREGDVSKWRNLFPNHSAFEMALNEDDFPVFKYPEKALKQAKSNYSDALDFIRQEYNLLPLSKYNYKKYGIYGWQLITNDEMISDQGRKLTQFIDIYENSFK